MSGDRVTVLSSQVLRSRLASMAFVWVFALCAGGASAQNVEVESVPAASEMTIAELSESVSNTLASLREFESYPMPQSFERRRTLEIRRDEKTIHLLGRIMSLADRVLALPEDAPERETLNQLMRARGGLIEEALVDRFISLTDRLNESLQRQADHGKQAAGKHCDSPSR